MKIIIKYVITFISIIVGFIFLLTLTSMIPKDALKENVKQSSDVLLKEGNRKKIYIPYRNEIMQFDNFSDSLMINTAYSIDPSTPLYSAFVARKNYIPNVTTEVYEDSAGELKSSSKYNYHNEVGELNDLVNNEKAESFEYARYWHGYLVVLRPLLVLFNLSQIRLIFKIILLILAILAFILIYKKIDIITAIIFIISLIGVEYFYMQYSIHGIFTFLSMMISSIIILFGYDKIKDLGLVFFITGMITNYNDLLTFPAISLGIPLLIFFMMEYKNKKIDIKEYIINLIKYIILWGIGYTLTWFAKWVLVDVLYNKNIIITSIKQVLYRSVNNDLHYGTLEIISENLKFETLIIPFTLIINVILNTITMLVKRNKHFNTNIKVKAVLQYIYIDVIISLIPIIIYILLKNHSVNHSFFTYRNLLITNFALNIILIKIYNLYITKEIENEKKENYS